MREIINYLIEANLCLLMFLVIHFFFLKNETNFSLTRYLLLLGILLSIVVPFFHLNNAGQVPIPTLGEMIPANWLPEVVIGPEGEKNEIATSTPIADRWMFIGWIYGLGMALFMGWLGVQIFNILFTMRSAKAYSMGNLKIFESEDDRPTFSFFGLIYIGRAGDLTPDEKEQVIRHEAVHARHLHSIDLLLVTVMRIAFWFNPILSLYKKIFIQLHEFEADARAVRDSDVNNYCSLLARVALQSAHFPIASHFNQSLTVKRIEMIRTIKKKISPWKLGVVAIIIPLLFIGVACQDQLAEIENSTVSQSGDFPSEVRAHADAFMKENPGAKLSYIVGIPGEIDKLLENSNLQMRVVYRYTYKDDRKGALLTDIVQHADALQTQDKVYMVVEQQPEYPGGYDAMKSFLRDNMLYPEADARAGTKGTVYVSFVVLESGTITDAKILRGLSPAIDAEALRVVNMLPAWIPGRQNGKAVKVRYNLPIRFGDASATSGSREVPSGTTIEQIQSSNYKMKVENVIRELNAATREMGIHGKIVREDGTALPGVNVTVYGTTTGTSTDINGNFTIRTKSSNGKLVFSFIGFETEVLEF